MSVIHRVYQKVIITLADGSKGVFVGQPLAWPDDTNQHVTAVEFTVPSAMAQADLDSTVHGPSDPIAPAPVQAIDPEDKDGTPV